MKAIPHVNIAGYPGAGKSITALRLSARHNTIWIPRVTTRPRRAGEGSEYIFVTTEEYHRMEKDGELLMWDNAHGVKYNPDGTEYRRGTLAKKKWPIPMGDTELLLSVIGTRVAPDITRSIAPDMISICLTASDDVLRRRIRDRVGRDSVLGHLDTIQEYRRLRVEDDFPYVIDTEFHSIEEVVQQIEEIAGLNRHALDPL